LRAKGFWRFKNSEFQKGKKRSGKRQQCTARQSYPILSW
jgi:hypothetical protein